MLSIASGNLGIYLSLFPCCLYSIKHLLYKYLPVNKWWRCTSLLFSIHIIYTPSILLNYLCSIFSRFCFYLKNFSSGDMRNIVHLLVCSPKCPQQPGWSQELEVSVVGLSHEWQGPMCMSHFLPPRMSINLKFRLQYEI